MSRQLIRRCAGTLLVVALAAGTADAAQLKDQVVQDPHYGEVLFYFYQQDYFPAITHLLAARELDRMPHHRDEAELLLGGMDLSYGLHQEASRIFRELLADSVPEQVRNRAWFYLAKLFFHRDRLEDAEDALARMTRDIPESVEGEARLLGALVFMADGRYEEAGELLRKWEGPKDWEAYALYNLGVALVRGGHKEEGIEILDEVGKRKARTEEMRALRDKANLALGYTLLQDQEWTQAKPYLERVRLDGPLSNKALLGVGWADANEKDYERALVPWMILREREVIDPAVQEAALAVPYAMGQIDAHAQAAQLYERAISGFGSELVRLDAAIAAVRQGKLIEALLSQEGGPEMGWMWRLHQLPDTPETHYLSRLLARNDFQEALKNYRDLRYLKRNLSFWANSIDAYDEMLATRREGYQAKLPQIQGYLNGVNFSKLQARRDVLDAKLQAQELSGDPVGLATPKEREQWNTLEAMEKVFADGAGDEAARDKQRLLKGLLLWQMNSQYPQRLWDLQREMKALDAALAQTAERLKALEDAQHASQAGFEGFEARIREQRERIHALQMRTDISARAQAKYVEDIAVAELQRRAHRLDIYRVQARFALAQVHDKGARAMEAERLKEAPEQEAPDAALPIEEEAPAEPSVNEAPQDESQDGPPVAEAPGEMPADMPAEMPGEGAQ